MENFLSYTFSTSHRNAGGNFMKQIQRFGWKIIKDLFQAEDFASFILKNGIVDSL